MMADIALLRTALALLTRPDPLTVRTNEFQPEALGPDDRSRLTAQVRATAYWTVQSDRDVVGLGRLYRPM